MKQLDVDQHHPAYLSGRMFAVCEEAQRRASHGRLNVTLVERFYAGVSVSPNVVLPALIRQMETAHLPKVRRHERRYSELRLLIDEITTPIKASKGWPASLLPADQGWFALGFYHQRAKFREEREEIFKRFREVEGKA